MSDTPPPLSVPKGKSTKGQPKISGLGWDESVCQNVAIVQKKREGYNTIHPVPGRANFRRDFFRGSVFVTMTILRGTILAQVHHHFPNSH